MFYYSVNYFFSFPCKNFKNLR